jgi:hypothetical protein
VKAAPSGKILLPNIRSLKWRLIDELPLINPLLGPHIQSLELSIDCDDKTLRSFLSQYSPDSLLHFDISYLGGGLERSPQIISKVICQWSQLRSLSVEQLTIAAFTHIAAFPDLQSLSVSKVILTPAAIVFPAFAFPALRSLVMGNHGMQFCIDVVEALSSCCLTDVTFQFHISSSEGKHVTDSLASTRTFIPPFVKST